MSHIVKMLFIVFVAFTSLYVNMNLSTFARSSKYLKEDIEIAVHDASISPDSIDQVQLAQGNLVFKRDEALQTFKESLERNTGLTEEDYEIIEFTVLDDSNTTFPVNFTSSVVEFSDTFEGATIFAVVKTQTDKYFYGTEVRDIIRHSSYTYIKRDKASIEVPPNLDVSSYNLQWPVPYTQNITSPFDPNRIHPIYGTEQAHNGIDIADTGVHNQIVVSAESGTVIFAGNLGGYGNLVIIKHDNGLETRYAHLNSIDVTNRQYVNKGDIIGRVGNTGDSTGSHLHFEVRIDGKAIDPQIFY